MKAVRFHLAALGCAVALLLLLGEALSFVAGRVTLPYDQPAGPP